MFDGDNEYYPSTSFIMPLLIDDSAGLEITANYSYGITAYDRDAKTANITADKDYSNIKVIFAAYNKSGELLSFGRADANLKKGENTITAPEDFTVNDGETLKVMVWNTMEDMTPLFDVFEQTYLKASEETGDTENTQTEE